MLEQPMIEKLLNMRLQGMADALKAQEQDPGARELSFIDRLSLLVDQQWNWRENQALARRMKSAKLRHNACIEDIDYAHGVGVRHVVVERFGEKKALSTIVALNEPLHLAHLRYRTRYFSNSKRCFDTLCTGSDCLDTGLQLRRPLSWWLPDGLHGVT